MSCEVWLATVPVITTALAMSEGSFVDVFEVNWIATSPDGHCRGCGFTIEGAASGTCGVTASGASGSGCSGATGVIGGAGELWGVAMAPGRSGCSGATGVIGVAGEL